MITTFEKEAAAESDLDAAMVLRLKSDIYGRVRDAFDRLEPDWTEQQLADAWLDVVRDVSDGITRLFEVVCDQKIEHHTLQEGRFRQLSHRLSDPTNTSD
jgi:hypothetical protein